MSHQWCRIFLNSIGICGCSNNNEDCHPVWLIYQGCFVKLGTLDALLYTANVVSMATQPWFVSSEVLFQDPNFYRYREIVKLRRLSWTTSLELEPVLKRSGLNTSALLNYLYNFHLICVQVSVSKDKFG